MNRVSQLKLQLERWKLFSGIWTIFTTSFEYKIHVFTTLNFHQIEISNFGHCWKENFETTSSPGNLSLTYSKVCKIDLQFCAPISTKPPKPLFHWNAQFVPVTFTGFLIKKCIFDDQHILIQFFIVFKKSPSSSSEASSLSPFLFYSISWKVFPLITATLCR